MRRVTILLGLVVAGGGCGEQPRAPVAPVKAADPDGSARSASIPKEPPMLSSPQSGAPADPDARFWALIENAAGKTGRGTEEHATAVLKALAKLPAAEIVAFDRFLHERLYAAYRWDLWAVAYIAMGGCGDDSFEYFRLWVIAQGKAYYEAAMKDPERAADAIKPGDEPDCEALLYAAAEAHESVAGSPLPPPGARAPAEPTGKPWEEKTVERLYPGLAKRFAR